jgi:hypothetical protein
MLVPALLETQEPTRGVHPPPVRAVRVLRDSQNQHQLARDEQEMQHHDNYDCVNGPSDLLDTNNPIQEVML